MTYMLRWVRRWIADQRLQHSPYWRGYFDGLNARERAHQQYLKLQKLID